MTLDQIMETFNVNREQALMIEDFGKMALDVGKIIGRKQARHGIAEALLTAEGSETYLDRSEAHRIAMNWNPTTTT